MFKCSQYIYWISWHNTYFFFLRCNVKKFVWNFPGGTVVKNPPANAEGMGLIPGLGRSHMPRSNYAYQPVCHNCWACALEPVSHNCWAHTPQLLKPMHPRAPVPQLLSPRAVTTEGHVPRARAPQEKPLQWEARAPQWRETLTRHNWRKPGHSNEDPTQPNIYINK